MAYWLYCQACKQWSKSATPLSDDKSCSFCNSLLVKTKRTTRLISEDLPGEIPPPPENESTISQTSQQSMKDEISNSSDQAPIEKQEAEEVSESGSQTAEFDGSEKTKVNSESEQPESAIAENSLAITETINPTENESPLEPGESLETKEVSPIAESLDGGKEPLDKECSDIAEESTSYEATEKAELDEKPEKPKVPEDAMKSETSIISEKIEISDPVEEKEPPVPHDIAADPSSSNSNINPDTLQDLTPEGTIEELEPDVVASSPETLEVPIENGSEEEEPSAESEELSDQSIEDAEALADDEDEMEEPSAPAYTPGHRMFLEDRRRKRKR